MTRSLSPDDDARLASAMAQGDERALARAFDAHGSLVYGLALRVCGDAHEADEVLHDVFFTFWRNAPRFDAAHGSLTGALAALTRDRALERVRRRAGRADTGLALNDGTRSSGRDDPSALDRSEPSEDAALAADALGRLPVEERRALEFAYFGGLSPSEIAGRTGDPLAIVGGRLRGAVRHLREALPRSGGASP